MPWCSKTLTLKMLVLATGAMILPSCIGHSSKVSDACVPASGGTRPCEVVTALVGGTIIDGNGGPSVRDGVLLIAGERILRVGPRTAVTIPPGARRIDVHGKYLVPGLIDANVHVSPYYNTPGKNVSDSSIATESLRLVRLMLHYGITTVRDTYGMLDVLRLAKDSLRQSAVPGPRLLVAGNVLGWDESGDARLHQNVGSDLLTMDKGTLHTAVETYLDKGVDFIKIGVTVHMFTPEPDGHAKLLFSREALEELVQTAHRHRKRVDIHANIVTTMRTAVLAGVDLIQHPEMVWADTLTRNRSGLIPERMPVELAQLIVKRGVICAIGPFAFSSLRRDRAQAAIREGNVTLLIRQGCIVAANSDRKKADGLFPVLEGLVELGMTPSQALTAATRNGAIAAGALRDYGTLEAGKRADVLVLQADPLADIRHLRASEMVIFNGQIVREGAPPPALPN